MQDGEQGLSVIGKTSDLALPPAKAATPASSRAAPKAASSTKSSKPASKTAGKVLL